MKIGINSSYLLRATKLAAPVIGGQLGIVLMGTTDTIMCGKVGNIAQAAVGLGSAIYFLFFVLGMGLYQGITTLVSIADGAQQRNQSKKYLISGLWLLLPTSIIINVLIWLSSTVLSYLSLPPEVVEQTQLYLSILLWGTPGLMLFILLSAFLNGLSKTWPTMLVTTIALIINYFLNDILIFGKLGMNAYGFAGSAYATNLSRYALALLLLIYIFLDKKIFKLLFAKIKYNIKEINKSVIDVGLPIGIQLFLEVFAFTASFIIAGWIGELHVATHQNVLNIASVTFMFITGISTASNIMIGNGYGARDKNHIMESAKACFYLIVFIEIIFAAIFVFAGEELLLLYTKDANVISLGVPLMIIAAAFQLSDGLQNLGLNMLRGIKDVRIPAGIVFLCCFYF